jgi:hypothetical protein
MAYPSKASRVTNRGRRNSGNDSSVRSPTSTSSDVRSPTSTKTATSGNVTVTGGAGAGANTRVVIHKKNKAHRKRTKLRKPVKRNSGTKRRRNPEGQAAETYRNFHGKDPDVVIEVATPVRYHGKLSGIGKLEFIKVVPVAGRGLVEIQFKGTMLAQNEKRTQLFITGGDQSVNIRDFGITRVHESEVLGECKEVGYFTEKLHLVAKDGGRALYVHKFGPNRPFIIYDTRNKLLSFAGGGYTIPSEGIDG